MRYCCKLAIVLTGCVSMAGPAAAVTECSVAVQSIFSGDDGSIWLFYTNGGSAAISNGDPDKAATLALATTALVGGRSVTVRYAAEDVPCAAIGRYDLTGFFFR